MPALKTYDLFLSHAWKYNADYYRLEEMLKQASNFYFRNYSVPTHNPVIDPKTIVGRSQLTSALDRQVKPVNCVLIIAGMYASHSAWIDTEINIAQKYGKPIIGIKPWGQERIPLIVQNAADEMVGWNTSTIVDAIRRNAI